MLATHDLVGLEAEVDELEIGDAERETLLRLPNLRGGPEALDGPRARRRGRGAGHPAARRDLRGARGAGRGRAGQLDLGLLRDLGYYTGAILEVYDPALGHVLGGGGRYDELMGRFGGRSRPRASRSTWSGARRAGGGATTGAGDGRMRGPGWRRRGARGGPLKLAVPRGALFEGTLELLDRIGVETAGGAGSSRSLVFGADGLVLVTMRPSDVPTYVEAGAADLGITGKDVCSSSGDRAVYELLDLRYGACRMVLAGRRGDESLGEAERRLGAMRIATKYPRTAERYFQETGRQAEVIEVKGSVELAPIVGLADGIVDLVNTGRTLTENELEVREEIARCTARLVANRVAHKLRAAEVDALAERLREATPE